MRIALADIKKDDDIYPRKQTSHKAIEAYAEALKAGARFPPILVQKLVDGTQPYIALLDGWHRYQAHQQIQAKDIEVDFWKPDALNKEEWLEALRIESVSRNLKHGERLDDADLTFQAQRIAKARPLDKLAGLQKELADAFGLTEGRLSQMISNIVSSRKQSRDALAFQLHLLGWTQREIAEIIGLTHPAVTEMVKNFNIKLFDQEYETGIAPEEIAKQHQMTEALTWAILLRDKPDTERFALFGNPDYGNEQPKLHDHWIFIKRDPRLGQDHPGKLFGQQIMNILYQFSKQGDLVVDPMAGGGSTIDTCLVMGRKCRAYDKEPKRKDIEPHDCRKLLPSRAQECDLIILDPPYFKKKETEYKCEEFTKDKITFLANMEKVGFSCLEALKPRGILAFLYGQYLDYNDEKESVLTEHLYELFIKLGFRLILTIQTPLSFNTQYQAHDVDRAKKQNPWQILPISRDWLIFRKETQ